jgi:hypothetical protein
MTISQCPRLISESRGVCVGEARRYWEQRNESGDQKVEKLRDERISERDKNRIFLIRKCVVMHVMFRRMHVKKDMMVAWH